MHWDVSTSNIMQCEGIGKLSDLEYAKRDYTRGQGYALTATRPHDTPTSITEPYISQADMAFSQMNHGCFPQNHRRIA